MTDIQTPRPVSRGNSVSKAWLRALELTTPIAGNPGRVFTTVIEELAAQFGDAPALLSDRECLTYLALAERVNQYSRWALDQGIAKGDVVCLLMLNRPDYMAIWLGITQIGGVVALVNTHLAGQSLAHCINIVAPKHIIAAAELVDALATALPGITTSVTIWVHGAGDGPHRGIDYDVERRPGQALSDRERRPLTIDDRALYIYTSGTTGLPKAVKVSHARIMQWSYWFAGMMDTQATDRMYNCLPMYHGVGGVLAPGAILVSGGSVVLREKFSARHFWSDVARLDCTLFQYIGELCRYLINSAPSPHDTRHHVRMACGNGLKSDIWNEFKDRFQIPQIFEFYGAAEGGMSLFNAEGKCGAIGRIPSYLAHRSSPKLIRFDVEKGEPFRDDRGCCISCAPNEVGEAIVPAVNDPTNVGGRFEGYTSKEESARRTLLNVFEPGDAWIRSGDLMRKDEKGFFYFVDRIGDTFRWKGENVSTTEVAEAICEFPGIKQANVYGVAIPGTDGRAGMATLVTIDDLDLVAFRDHLIKRLPHYARPLFLRICQEMEITGTFKYTKADLGYDPTATSDVLYFNDSEHEAFVWLDKTLYERIDAGQIRL